MDRSGRAAALLLSGTLVLAFGGLALTGGGAPEGPARPATPTPTPTPTPTSAPTTTPTPTPPPPPPPPPTPRVGYDVSWPQCPVGMGIPERRTLGLPGPKEDAEFVVIGLTNGPAFTPNPCLTEQVREAQERELWTAAYAIVTYPTPEQLQTHGGAGPLHEQLRRVGRAQAAENVAKLEAAGLSTPIVWVDVEPSTVRPWPGDPGANNALVDGVIEGYQEVGYRVGLYSYPSGWAEITGGRQVPDFPVWMPSGKRTSEEALSGCARPSFSGGPVALGQSTDGEYDYNRSCPDVTSDPDHPGWEEWFARPTGTGGADGTVRP